MTSFLSVVLILILANSILFGLVFYKTVTQHNNETSPTNMLDKVATAAAPEKLSSAMADQLLQNDIWAMYLNSQGQANWSVNLPDNVPSAYSLQDIAQFSKGYIKDYPVFIRTTKEGLIILGYPKNSYAKLLSNYYPIQAIKKFPFYLSLILIIDAFCLFFIYLISRYRFIKKTEPIISAIEDIANAKPISLEIDTEFSDIASSIHKASLVLNKQNLARANWIDGISHDIRTPLSLIIGYADSISSNEMTTEKVKNQAKIIRNQSLAIKELVQDLNIVSKLEYEMQPLHKEKIIVSKLLRSCLANILNSTPADNYDIAIEIESNTENIKIDCDRRLITRAITNLINNSIKHNPQGCKIMLRLALNDNFLSLSIIDNGKGISDEKIAEFKNRQHYMYSSDDCLDLRHGLGLLIVKQIACAHEAQFEIKNSLPNGCRVILSFPYNP